jgi:hypothetical protein
MAVWRLLGPMPCMFWPLIRIWPSVGSIKPEIRRKSGLAAARGPQEAEKLAGLDMHVYIPDGVEIAKLHAYLFDSDILTSHYCAPSGFAYR